MRTIWRDDVASYDGEFTRFEAIRVHPKPARDRSIPVVLGGNSDGALRRVAAWADGWYGFYLPDVAAVEERIGFLRNACRERDRDPADLSLAVALRTPQPEDVAALAELGVDEIVVVEGPPADANGAADWVAALAQRWKPPGPG